MTRSESPWLRFGAAPLLLAAGVLLLDQLTKVWILRLLCGTAGEPARQIVVIPGFFSLVCLSNTGAAWGILRGQTLLLSILSLAVAIFLVLRFSHLAEGRVERGVALALILGGVCGNLIDRVFREDGVVDFLHFYYGDFQWPAFNVADTAISCGVILYVLSSLLVRTPVHDEPEGDVRPRET